MIIWQDQRRLKVHLLLHLESNSNFYYKTSPVCRIAGKSKCDNCRISDVEWFCHYGQWAAYLYQSRDSISPVICLQRIAEECIMLRMMRVSQQERHIKTGNQEKVSCFFGVHFRYFEKLLVLCCARGYNSEKFGISIDIEKRGWQD